jgi:hypothetical protein
MSSWGIWRRPAAPNLTADEKAVLTYLVSAWEAFKRLPDPHPSDELEFRTSLHSLQQLIACRVARRVDPDCWYQPPPDQVDRPAGLDVET